MSAFSTTLPLALDYSKLPPNSFVDKVTVSRDNKHVVVLWHNDRLVSKYTFHQNFPLEMLEDAKLPEGVTHWQSVKSEGLAKKPVDKKKGKAEKVR